MDYNNAPSTLSVNYANTAGSANAVEWNNVSGKPSTYTPSSHSHTIAQVTDLQSSLDGKAAKSHTHAIYYLKTQTITLGDGTDLPSSYSGGNIFKNP